MKKKKYLYKEYKISIFKRDSEPVIRFAVCKFGNKFCFRFEISKGWD